MLHFINKFSEDAIRGYSEWSSNIEDLGENAIDILGYKKTDIPDMLKAGIKIVADLYDGYTLSEKLREVQTEIDNIAITIPHRHEPAAFHTSWQPCETLPFPSDGSLDAQKSRKHYESSLTDLNSQLTLFSDNS